MMSISRYDVYLSRMEKSMYDKLFFVDKIFDDKIDTFFDFGCANGTLIQYVHNFMPNLKYVGYDIDPTMCEEARKNVPYAEFYSNWEDAFARVNPGTCVLNLSSVIHEVHSYCTPEEQDEFWRRVGESGWAYITVRDMVRYDVFSASWRENERLQDLTIDLNRSPMYSEYREAWEDFKAHWSTHPAQVVHFLMKYKYKENWAREVLENYIPFTPDAFAAKIFSSFNADYKCTYHNIYTLPYIADQVQKDFHFDLTNISTHMQYIYKKNS